MFGSAVRTLIILNEQINDIIKIIKSLKESGLLIKGVSETIKKGGFSGTLLGTLDASLLGKILTSKGKIRTREGTIRVGEGTISASEGTIRAGEGTIRAGLDV